MPEIIEVYLEQLRFTQPDISRVFKHGEHAGKSVVEVADKLREGIISVYSLPLDVHEMNDREYWCENNRSLYALRRAGYSSKIRVTVNKNNYKSRRLNDAVKEELKRSDFLPRIRGSDTARSALEDSSVEEETSSSSLKTWLLVGAAAFAGYKYFK